MLSFEAHIGRDSVEAPKRNTPGCCVVSQNIIVLNELLAILGVWFIRGTISFLCAMGIWEGSLLVVRDGK